MEWLGGNTHSFPFPQNLKFFFPQNWEEWEGLNLGIMKFLLKSLKYPLLALFFSFSCKKYSYHSYTILPVLYKVKLLPLIFLFLLSAAIFGYCSNQVCPSFSFSFRLFASLFFFIYIYELFSSHSWEWYIVFLYT